MGIAYLTKAIELVRSSGTRPLKETQHTCSRIRSRIHQHTFKANAVAPHFCESKILILYIGFQNPSPSNDFTSKSVLYIHEVVGKECLSIRSKSLFSNLLTLFLSITAASLANRSAISKLFALPVFPAIQGMNIGSDKFLCIIFERVSPEFSVVLCSITHTTYCLDICDREWAHSASMRAVM